MHTKAKHLRRETWRTPGERWRKRSLQKTVRKNREITIRADIYWALFIALNNVLSAS